MAQCAVAIGNEEDAEKVFGIKLETGPAGEQQVAGMVEQKDRTITVQFDATVNSKLPWAFKPQQLTMQVHPGKQYEANYLAAVRTAGEPMLMDRAQLRQVFENLLLNALEAAEVGLPAVLEEERPGDSVDELGVDRRGLHTRASGADRGHRCPECDFSRS